MKTHIPVTHIMTSQVLTVEKNTSLSEVESIMKRKHIRHLPVVNGLDVVGIISLTDLQRLSYTASFADDEREDSDDEVAILNLLSLDQVMVSKPFTIQKTATVGDAADILIKMDFHALPVLDGTELIGIVTSTDLLKYFTGKF
jgi:signal-transduction protein with cAMP-binding, CBS, and nucleotidyltransferase domain